MVIAWLVTLPAAALVGGVSASVVTNGGNVGTAIVAVVGAALAMGIVALSWSARPRKPRPLTESGKRCISTGPHSARSPR